MSVTDIKTPSITTLSIEVKAIKIGKKQCTISVFNQLPYLSLSKPKKNWVDANVWGHVLKGDGYVVFENHGKLFKSRFPEKEHYSEDFMKYIQKINFEPALKEIGAKLEYATNPNKEKGIQPWCIDFSKYKWFNDDVPEIPEFTHDYYSVGLYAIKDKKMWLPITKSSILLHPDLWPPFLYDALGIKDLKIQHDRNIAEHWRFDLFCNQCYDSDQLFIGV